MYVAHTKDTMSDIYLDALSIRNQVFVKEQQVPVKLEIDTHEAYCIHFVLYNQVKVPMATVRLYPLDGGSIKVQRMAVLKDFRQKGLGKYLLKAAEKFAQEQGFQTIVLGAQLTAKPFYQSLDYQEVGSEFLDAGIPHITMTKKFDS